MLQTDWITMPGVNNLEGQTIKYHQAGTRSRILHDRAEGGLIGVGEQAAAEQKSTGDQTPIEPKADTLHPSGNDPALLQSRLDPSTAHGSYQGVIIALVLVSIGSAEISQSILESSALAEVAS